MSRARRLVVVLAAWTAPAAWVAVALLSGPSDGASIAGSRWGDTVRVTDAYADSPLREGDTVLEIDGRDLDSWVTEGAPDRQVGDVVPYLVRRAGSGLDVIVTVQVPLQRYPLADAALTHAPTLAMAATPLVAASWVFWRRPSSPATALLAATALAPAALTAAPLGLGPIDLAGGRGTWPYAVGQAAFAIGMGCALLVALTFCGVPRWLRSRPWTAALPFAVPAVGYAVWLAVAVPGHEPGAARLQTVETIAVPAVVAACPVAAGVLLLGYLRARERRDRLAVRLVLLALAAGAAGRLILVDVPRWLAGAPIVPWGVLGLLLVPAVLSCVVVAMLRYRLEEIEPSVRRALAQAVALLVVGSVFAAVASAVGRASDTSFDALVAGGVLALLLLPLALGLQRAVVRLLHRDRELPRQVVTELRALDPLTAPEDVLGETLALLCRRLHLSYAALEETGPDAVDAAIGESRGEATTVDLVVGGAPVGRLLLEVEPDRAPFGAGDRRLLEDVGSQVGVLVQAVAINRELQRSRQELVTAREEERRRVRRDLHDGLGPSLATLAMGLEAAGDLIPDDPDRAATLVAELSERARAEIGEVRRLVEGLRPPALDQLGLVSALRQRADQHNSAARAASGTDRMTWSVEADDIGQLPAAIEVAAYRIVVEAVNNAARHSTASTCTVTVRRDLTSLHIRVCDRGTGLGPARGTGIGLSSMRERAEELGGTCTLTSYDGTGTVVEARLPLPSTSVRGGAG
ncbi:MULTISPECIES: sensor histidine kinase [unclassified Nocardioides]|uniref:sensor histidine kinase n=1 Tax=unclassified Nocardioides TaxID=2615069 RepID=UPI00362268BF